ncbi:MAG TPA: hypothetical protein VIM14_09460 [Polyangia bacterium]
MLKTLSFLVSLASVPAPYTPDAVIAADDQRELPSVEDLSTQPEVFLVSDQRKKDCPRVGSVCIFANGGGTIAGIDVNPTVGIVTTLASGTQVASTARTGTATQTDAWHVEMIAKFRTRTTSAEPVIVAVMDYLDPDSIVRKEATAVWQIDGAATKNLGMRLVFSAEDGFLPHHTYLIRMVQGDGADEKVLAEGNFMLE